MNKRVIPQIPSAKSTVTAISESPIRILPDLKKDRRELEARRVVHDGEVST